MAYTPTATSKLHKNSARRATDAQAGKQLSLL